MDSAYMESILRIERCLHKMLFKGTAAALRISMKFQERLREITVIQAFRCQDIGQDIAMSLLFQHLFKIFTIT